MMKSEFVAGAMIAEAPGLSVVSREQSIDLAGRPGTCRGGKSGLQRVRWWVTPTVGAHGNVAPIGTVPQKRDRLDSTASCTESR